MKKKYLVMIILVLVGIELIYCNSHREAEYNSIEEYIQSKNKAKFIDVIESNGYYFVLEQYSANNMNYEILYHNDKGKFSTVNTSRTFDNNVTQDEVYEYFELQFEND